MAQAAHPVALRYRSNWYAGFVLDGTAWHYPLRAYGSHERAFALSKSAAAAQNCGHDQTQGMSDKLTLVSADDVF